MTKTVELQPSWKRWFWSYLFGILLIPLLGLGLLLLWRAQKKKKQILYEVTNQQIKSRDRNYSQSVDLVNITSVDVEQNWIDQKLGIGDLLLKTDTRRVVILGQEEPHKLMGMIAQAVEAERKRVEQYNKKDPDPVDPPQPGTIDKIDYLTGLWQQGLITNEEFEKEKKHFEK